MCSLEHTSKMLAGKPYRCRSNVAQGSAAGSGAITIALSLSTMLRRTAGSSTWPTMIQRTSPPCFASLVTRVSSWYEVRQCANCKIESGAALLERRESGAISIDCAADFRSVEHASSSDRGGHSRPFLDERTCAERSPGTTAIDNCRFDPLSARRSWFKLRESQDSAIARSAPNRIWRSGAPKRCWNRCRTNMRVARALATVLRLAPSS